MSYKMESTVLQRSNESSQMLSRYPGRIPVICESNSDVNEQPSRMKYLVPKELTVGQLSYVIRKRFSVSSDKSIFLFVNNKVIPPTSACLNDVYNTHRDEDGFLYVYFSLENTFG